MLSVCSLTRHGFFRAWSPRIAAMSSIRLLVVSGSPPDSSFSMSPVRSSTAQPPGPGLPRQAPSVNISTAGRSLTSGDELARELEDHALGAVVGDLLGDIEPLGKRINHLANQYFRCGSAGSEADGLGLAEPFPIDVGG